MGDLINLDDKRKKKEQTPTPIVKPSEIAAVETVDYMRQKMYSMSEESRVQFMFVVLTHLIKWIIKSGYYDKPGAMILAWVEKKINDYSMTERTGK
jgi:hypothetical protein